MENLSHSRHQNSKPSLTHSLSKKACNGGSGLFPTKTTTYDDVFGGPPRFGGGGPPTLAPRVEDYSEIFGGFHASRASSIPVLDLPLFDDDNEAFFDVKSSGFDYNEVFGGFNGLDFAVSHEELMRQSNGSVSDEAWMPADTDSFSGESDHSGQSRCFPNGDSHESIDGSMEFNISYHKNSQVCDEDMSNGIMHVAHLRTVPGYSYLVDKTTPFQVTDDGYPTLQVIDDSDLSMEFSGEMIKGKGIRKTKSHIVNGSAGEKTFGNICKLQKTYGRNNSLPTETFVTVSDVSLRTRPCVVPPPSRPPPPAVDVKNGDVSRLCSTCKPVTSDWKAGNGSPSYFDVEVDASSSAAASAAAIKDAMEKAQAKLKSAKELMERKKEGFQSRTRSGSKHNRKDSEGKVGKIANGSTNIKDERLQSSFERENIDTILDERQKVRKAAQAIPDLLGEEKNLTVAQKSDKGKHEKESWATHGSYIDEASEWKEATEFFELVGADTSLKAFEQANGENILLPETKTYECGHKERKGTFEALEQQQENSMKVKASGEDYKLEEYEKKLKVAKETCERVESNGSTEPAKEARRLKGEKKKVKVTQGVCEQEENGKKGRMAWQKMEAVKKLNEADELEEPMNLANFQQEEHLFELRHPIKLREIEQQLEEANMKSFERDNRERKLKQAVDQVENQKRLKEVRKQEEKEKRLKEVHEREVKEKKHKEALEREEIENKAREALERMENEKRLKEALEREESERRLREAVDKEENERKQREARQREEIERRQKEALEQEENEKKQREAWEREENERRLQGALEHEANKGKQEASESEDTKQRLEDACETEEMLKILREVHKNEENGRSKIEDALEQENFRMWEEAEGSEENEMVSAEAFKQEENGSASRDTDLLGETEDRLEDSGWIKELNGLKQVHEQPQEGVTAMKLNTAEGAHAHKEGQHIKITNEAHKLDDTKNCQATQSDGKLNENNKKLEGTKEDFAHAGNGNVRSEPKDSEKETEAFQKVDVHVNGTSEASSMVQSNLEHVKDSLRMEDVGLPHCRGDSLKISREVGLGAEQRNDEKVKAATQSSDIEIQGKKFGHESMERGKDKFMSSGAGKESVETGRKFEAVQPSAEGKANAQKMAWQANASQNTDRKEKNFNGKLTSEEKEDERVKRERDMEKERLRKIEEELEREREREKDRMAVDRVILEVRDRAYADARERVERAALERATAEARQRAMSEARERLEKACAEAREKSLADKTVMEARLRAEQAAVERATAEARERAAEKAAFEARERAASSRNTGIRPSASSSDLQDQQLHNVGYFNGQRHPLYSSGVEGESAQRCKARLERHRRTAERAAKALAEKNMRDLLAQREQAERNRLAETLDADVKRWSSGKEGNLRALLSTLQYILGPESGWQPIPLTEVITAAAVKKAYRKATLCVHPDKLQQRGASIQQKYICEKVFDLLKEAWNKFNSEER